MMKRRYLPAMGLALLAILMMIGGAGAETKTKAPYTFENLDEETKSVAIVAFNPTGKISEEGIDLDIPATLGEYVVTGIGDNAFKSQRKLKRVSVPEGVTFIGTRAFNGCDGIESIRLPDSLTTIGNRAFSNCKGMKSIELPGGVTKIGEWVFSDCAYCLGHKICAQLRGVVDHDVQACLDAGAHYDGSAARQLDCGALGCARECGDHRGYYRTFDTVGAIAVQSEHAVYMHRQFKACHLT